MCADLSWQPAAGLADTRLGLKAAALADPAGQLAVLGPRTRIVGLAVAGLTALETTAATHAAALAKLVAEEPRLVAFWPGYDPFGPDGGLAAALLGAAPCFWAYRFENLAGARLYLAFPAGTAAARDAAASFAAAAGLPFADLGFGADFEPAVLQKAGVLYGPAAVVRGLARTIAAVSAALVGQAGQNRQPGFLRGLFGRGAFAPVGRPLKPYLQPRGMVGSNSRQTIVIPPAPLSVPAFAAMIRSAQA